MQDKLSTFSPDFYVISEHRQENISLQNNWENVEFGILKEITEKKVLHWNLKNKKLIL